MKVVADTMIWVSYCTVKDGFRHRLIDIGRRRRVRYFVSAYILQELRETLIDDLGLTRRFANLARRRVSLLCKEVNLPKVVGEFVPGDVDDNPIVQTALSAKADFLVTADKEILRVRKVQDVEIITAQRFAELLEMPS
jgi:putative PIN family toxin of toxin-antitoxin system